VCFDQRDNFGEFRRVGKGMFRAREVFSDESVEQAWFQCNVVHVFELLKGCHWNRRRAAEQWRSEWRRPASSGAVAGEFYVIVAEVLCCLCRCGFWVLGFEFGNSTQ